MEVYYDCVKDKVVITPFIESIIEIGVKKGCSEDITTTTYCNGENVNFINAEGFIANYEIFYDPGCPDPPGTGCNTCPQFSQFSYGVNLNIDDVVSVNGTVTITIDGFTTVTNITSMSYFNATHSAQSYTEFEIEYDLNFVCTNGIVFHFVSLIYSNGQFCEMDDYTIDDSFDYECDNSYSNSGGNSYVKIVLEDGFYTALVNGEYFCFLVECSPLECRVYKTLDFCCDDCTDKNSEAFLLYQMFLTCEDCCTKNTLYRKLNALLNKCSTC